MGLGFLRPSEEQAQPSPNSHLQPPRTSSGDPKIHFVGLFTVTPNKTEALREQEISQCLLSQTQGSGPVRHFIPFCFT